jgi:hypothetical protein
LTTAPETDIRVGFSARALCPATFPLPEKPADLGLVGGEDAFEFADFFCYTPP